jgi:hypothetical protein
VNTSTATLATRFRPVLVPLLLLVLAAIPLLIFLENPFQLLLERHSFRQTQTALTAYWLVQGGDFFRYLTPVLGAPWLVPLELPLFQGLVAMVSSTFGLPLDFSGRLVSFFFFLLTSIPIALCLRRYGWSAVILAIAVLFTSPVNVFYARAFLIETTATFLALSALCLYVGYIRTRRSGFLVGLVLCGTLAGLQKITTFLPVFGVCCLDLLYGNFRQVIQRAWRQIDVRPMLAVAGSMILPVSWSIYSDAVKEEGPISALMTAGRLTDSTFGTVAQHLDIKTWQLVFYDRLFLYGGLGVGLLILAFATLRKGTLPGREAALFAGAGLLGPLVFLNLHWVHDYYQLACIAFFACAIAISVSPYLERLLATGWTKFAGLVVLVVGVNLFFFQQRYAYPLRSVQSGAQVAYEVATWVKERQAERDAVVVFGMKWSSTVPYYAARYGLVVPEDAPQRAEIVSNPRAFTGDREIGSIVYCLNSGRSVGQMKQEMETLFRQLDGPSAQFDHCTVMLRGNAALQASRTATSPGHTSDR